MEMEARKQGSNKMIIGIVLAVLTFWLFALSMVNIIPAIQADLGISLGTLSIAISITSLFSGMFIVVAGGISDRAGRKKLTFLGLILQYYRLFMSCFCTCCSTLNRWAYHPGYFCSMYYACNYCFS